MRISLLLVALLLAQTASFKRVAQAQDSTSVSSPTASGNNQPAAPGVIETAKPATANKVVVRGWQIQAVSALKQTALSEVSPEYDQKRPIGNRTTALAPTKGSFLVVLVQCESATGQSLSEPLWVGKPDVTLVDDQGLEYPALGKLTQQGAQLVTQGMVTGPNRGGRRTPPGVRTSALIYFDVPISSQAFWLRFGEAGPSVPVSRVQQLPGVPTE